MARTFKSGISPGYSLLLVASHVAALLASLACATVPCR